MLHKIIFRDQIKNYLLERMLTGGIQLGQRINLPGIAKELEVSVTPVREALTQLTGSGIVKYIANRGFFIPELSKKEAKDIYPIIATLESEGLVQSKFSPKQIHQLKHFQKKFKSAQSPEEAVKWDMKFHETLLENYPNNTAKKIIKELKIRIFYYELEYMRQNLIHELSSDHHKTIVKQIERGNLPKASIVLQQNWETGLTAITQFLKKRQHKK